MIVSLSWIFPNFHDLFWRVRTKSSNKEKKMTLRTLLRVAGSTGVVIPAAAEASSARQTGSSFLGFAELVAEAVRPREIQTFVQISGPEIWRCSKLGKSGDGKSELEDDGKVEATSRCLKRPEDSWGSLRVHYSRWNSEWKEKSTRVC